MGGNGARRVAGRRADGAGGFNVLAATGCRPCWPLAVRSGPCPRLRCCPLSIPGALSFGRSGSISSIGGSRFCQAGGRSWCKQWHRSGCWSWCGSFWSHFHDKPRGGAGDDDGDCVNGGDAPVANRARGVGWSVAAPRPRPTPRSCGQCGALSRWGRSVDGARSTNTAGEEGCGDCCGSPFPC